MSMFYKSHVRLDQIIEDGWARGFQVEQTLEEARAHGYDDVTVGQIMVRWSALDKEELRANSDC